MGIRYSLDAHKEADNLEGGAGQREEFRHAVAEEIDESDAVHDGKDDRSSHTEAERTSMRPARDKRGR
jgi:hypothetical protein